MPIIYILIFGYLLDGVTIYNIFKTFMFLLVIRLLLKDPIDILILLFFKRSSYKIDDSIKYSRKKEIKKNQIKK